MAYSYNGYDSTSYLIELISRKIHADKKLFESLYPTEYKSLTELMNEIEPGVRLASGDFYKFNISDLRKLYETLPWYLRGFTLLPFVFIYKREEYNAYYKLVTPSKWTRRALNYILYNDYTKELSEVKPGEMRRLLREFKTLIIILIEVNI